MTTRYSKTPYCCDFVLRERAARRAGALDRRGHATQASDHQPVLLELDDR